MKVGCSRLVLFFYFALIHAVILTSANQNCYETGNYTSNSTYRANLDSLLSSMSSNTKIDYGFYNFSAGKYPNKVNAIALCRGDISPNDCHTCINTSSQDLLKACPNQKEAIIWATLCFVRYSNRSIFGFSEANPRTASYNTGDVADVVEFNKVLFPLLESLRNRASSGNSTLKFALQSVPAPDYETIYALLQCTPDLTKLDCDSCLSQVQSFIPQCCKGKQGGIFVAPSCNIRFEIYPFYEPSAEGPPQSPPPPPSSPVPPVLPPTTQGKSHISSLTIVAIVAPISVSVVLFLMGYCFLVRRKAKKKYGAIQEEDASNEISTVESLQFDFATIEAATNKFSDDNKLGEGGFGRVYKGILPNGQEIAVKRLSRSSGQGAGEFKNEVVLVAKLQHRNLVRLLGFCLEGGEKILVYEFVPNKSFDYFLYDREKNAQLNWSSRYKIIGGIARGILYLHEDSRLRIIHRDLKASNVLLDADMNPKISDFGMAKLFGVDQTQGNTSRVVGTFGYMAPEYAMHGQFSVKSDVYSFGVLILEILSGKRNSSFYQSDGAADLLSYAWKHWRDETLLEFLDPTLHDSYSRNEVIRCLQIGLLCVQDDPIDRPTMASIVLILNSYSMTLSSPKQPAYFLRSRTEEIMPLKESELSDKSTSKSMPGSVNEASITEVYPR